MGAVTLTRNFRWNLLAKAVSTVPIQELSTSRQPFMDRPPGKVFHRPHGWSSPFANAGALRASSNHVTHNINSMNLSPVRGKPWYSAPRSPLSCRSGATVLACRA